MKNWIIGVLIISGFAVGFWLHENVGFGQKACGWNIVGAWIIDHEYQGTSYPHDLVINDQTDTGFTGSGGWPGGRVHLFGWNITGGHIAKNTFEITAMYDDSAPGTKMTMKGMIGEDGTLNGVWADDYQGQYRSGMFTTIAGKAYKRYDHCFLDN